MQAVQQQETSAAAAAAPHAKPSQLLLLVNFHVAVGEKIRSGSYSAYFGSSIDAIVDALENIPMVCRIRVRPVGANAQPLEITGWAA